MRNTICQVVCAAIVSLLVSACAANDGSHAHHTLPHTSQPTNSTTTLMTNHSSGLPVANTIDWDKLKGKVVYVDFWATWCGHCQHSFPWLNAMKARYQDEGFEVVAINLDENPQLIAPFLKNTPAKFDVYYDSNAIVAQKFKVQMLPTTIIIDRMGQQRVWRTDFKNNDLADYEREIKMLLDEKSHTQ